MMCRKQDQSASGSSVSRRRSSLKLTASLFAGVAGLVAGAAFGQTISTDLQSFHPQIGFTPNGTLVADPAGVLYGTTQYGGGSNGGTVFSYQPSGGAIQILHSFNGLTDGVQPDAPLALAADGSLIGTTMWGGAFGLGAIFQIKPAKPPATGYTETIIYSFSGGTDGDFPVNALTTDEHGVVYGTVITGGQSPTGIAFSLTPPSASGGSWSFRTIYSFPTTYVTSLQYHGQALFGLIYDDSYPNGSVFVLSPPKTQNTDWVFNVVHNFAGGAEGATPTTFIMANDQTIYGTTTSGGANNAGTLFALPIPRTGHLRAAITLNDLPSSDNGIPVYGLAVGSDGALYGTITGTAGYTHGKIVKFAGAQNTAPWTESTIYTFTGDQDGDQPSGNLVVAPDGQLYGVTTHGGHTGDLSDGYGTVFKITP